ncbi:DUF4192 family protein (plasmid) [Micrococcus luteus]
MKTLNASSPLALADFAATVLRKVPEASVVAIGMKGKALGPVMRVDDVAPAEYLGTYMAKYLQKAGYDRAVLIGYGPEDRAPRWFEVEAAMADHGVPLAALVAVDGKTCTDLTTGQSEPYAPGTSDLGLSLAVEGGAPVPHPTATPEDTAALAPLIAEARERLGDFPTDIRALGRAMSRLLRDRSDREAAAVVLATLDHPDAEYLHAAMVAVTAPQRTETVDFLTGTFPHGLSWKATEEAEAVLNAAVAMGPREAAAGALAVLAYVAWLRGQGAQADERLNLASACTPGHAHVRAVFTTTTGTPVAFVARDRVHAWRPVEG